MNQRIIYPNDAGGIAVIVPAPGVDQQSLLSLVPAGKPYLVVLSDDIPTDRTFRGAWTADFTNAPVKE